MWSSSKRTAAGRGSGCAVADLSDHLEVQDAGSIVILRPISDAARAWFRENVGAPEPGGVYYVEPRYAGPIVEGAARDLLTWQ